MAKKNARNTRGRIVEAAWRLFYDQGYEDTTVEEIIESSQTSKGSFYHYFDGKDALLSTLSDLFDQKYQDLQAVMPPEMPTMEKLLFLNRELFRMIEDSVSIDLMARLLSTQLDGEPASAGSQAHLLPPAPPHHRRGPGGGRADPEPQRQRHGEGLRPL